MNGASPNINKGTPKTPGGISKSLLTPCRRVGLSRKWKKSGCSPFISPLGGQIATPERIETRERKKRKITDESEQLQINTESPKEQLTSLHKSSLDSPISCDVSNKINDITSTPTRNNHLPRKKSKTLLLKNSQETEKEELSFANEMQHNKKLNLDESQTIEMNAFVDKTVNDTSNKKKTAEANIKATPDKEKQISKENISKPVRKESKSKLSLKKSFPKSNCDERQNVLELDNVENNKPKENSPNNLTKECIVVIQKKILKINPDITMGKQVEKALQDTDSEPDLPLSEIKKESVHEITLNTLDDNDFISKPVKKPIRNLSIKRNKVNTEDTQSSNSSQSSQEGIDKRTIIVKKTYNKVIKPLKAKSTGSITQKDIDEIKARIEMKKKLLLAKAMSIDTEELRGLIKKWQKGCQDALMELLDLMKKKMPDRQNMDYSEILATLKIPAELVGYDSDNDCFVTPDDTNILLSAFKL